ncbi:hypothetical protein HGP16_27920 [Rhizobium sp. P40RR-XXII]|uniref:hypothetical protein n=1 Tax=Rhizobium sp. P40RR-XXII TaxID=2726739 RepID=UPI0014578DAD|nr:hypothetical protein [Rhizobium sp. P40RR-XXII]NLS20362.1 hypothetical protein [Rhizobium sp. P40RR-XXII]
MERLHRLANSALLPVEIQALKGIFDFVVGQPWFDPNDYSAEGFAVRLIALYRYGVTDPPHLKTIALFWALKDFSCDMKDDQRAKLKANYEVCQSLARNPL